MKKILIAIPTHDGYANILPQVYENAINITTPKGFVKEILVVADDQRKMPDNFYAYISEKKIDFRIVKVDMKDFTDNGYISSHTDCTQLNTWAGCQVREFYRQVAIQKNYDYLLHIDGDILPPKNSLKLLLAANKDVIGGWAKNKKHPGVLVAPYSKLKFGNIFEVMMIGSYCLLEKRKVFENVNYSLYSDKLNSTDDIKRLTDIKLSGFKIFCHPNVYCEHLLKTGEVFTGKNYEKFEG